jgi:hypothetical protein
MRIDAARVSVPRYTRSIVDGDDSRSMVTREATAITTLTPKRRRAPRRTSPSPRRPGRSTANATNGQIT